MAAEILISSRPIETRVAYIENGVLIDLIVERRTSPTLVGSIFRGKVVRVLPGMQASFVDIGLDRAAFLYVGDVRDDLADENSLFLEGESEADDGSGLGDANKTKAPVVRTPIQDLLKEGQDILIQVAKDPIGTKGARITTHISIPGRHIVYLPTLNHFGVSRKIEDVTSRERLRKIIDELEIQGGVIVRTAGESADKEKLKADVDYLNRIWGDVQKSYQKRKTPGLIHAEPDLELRALRDLLNENVERILIDDFETFKKVEKFVAQFMPKFRNTIRFYNEETLLFDQFDVEMEISRSMERKIWLKSGGYIVIDEAEALTVVDINTGKFVGKKDFEETILKTNLEAVREIAHQLRIRNCGGIIIIDFIDMEKEQHREMVLNLLKEELQRDRARTNVLKMSDLGLVEMTRKRIRPSLVKTLCEPCTYCSGRGYVKSKATVAHEIFREIERSGRPSGRTTNSIMVHCHADVADWIYAEESAMLDFLEHKMNRPIALKVEPSYHIEQFDIFCY